MMFNPDQGERFKLAEKARFLIPGNRGQAASGSRTLFEVTRLIPSIGMFEIKLLDGKDEGTNWLLPYEDVRAYDFFDDSKMLQTTDFLELVGVIIKFSQELTIPLDESKRAQTLKAIAIERAKCRRWLKARGAKPFNPELFVKSRKGSDVFTDLLKKYMESENLDKLDETFSTAYVHNPLSGEIVKGHSIVLAELGLVEYRGKVVRDPKLFKGQWTKNKRAEHIIKRIAFVRELWALSGQSSVKLYRAYGHEKALIDHRPSFLSTTFSLRVAQAIFKSPNIHVGVLFRQEVPIERLFMTFLETSAMNRQHSEAEAIILADRENLAF